MRGERREGGRRGGVEGGGEGGGEEGTQGLLSSMEFNRQVKRS